MNLKERAKKLKSENGKVDGVFKAVEALKEIKARLEEIRGTL